ncbi:MAG: amidohydrolase family protein [Proteobacteria bacterium]|nr:amidohydrolase family protein [Pseudomonadota bacterium]
MHTDGTRFIVAGSLIDGSGANVRKNVLLTVKEGIITAIDSAAHLPRKDRALIDDFSYCTILPPLVDCSVSLSRSPSVDMRVQLSSKDAGLSEKTAMVARHINYCGAYGVLGVAVNDDITNLVEHSRRVMEPGRAIDIRTFDRPSPDLKDCGPYKSTGGDFLKIGYSANIEDEDGPYPRFDHDALCRILQHRGRRKAVVVANGVRQVEEAIEAGCEAIEQGYGMGEDNLKRMANKGILWIPSVLRAKNALDGAGSGGDVCCRFSQRYVAPGKPVPGAEAFWKKMLAEHLRQLRFARNVGVTTAMGTGAGSMGILHGESMVEEMKLFIKAGWSLAETFRSASENGARFFGMENLGQLCVGRKATFLITRGSVQQLPRKLSYLEGIYVDGMPSIAYHKNPVKPS